MGLNDIKIKSLNSERDKNFLLIVDSKKKYVLKLSNSKELKDLLNLQDYVLSQLSFRTSINKFIPKKIHSSIKSYEDIDGNICFVRILSYIEGEMYASVKQDLKLEKSLGNLLGNLSNELQNLMKPAALRKFQWDPSKISWINKKYLYT